MAITINGDSPNFSSAVITTGTVTTLTTTTLSDGTNSTSATNCIQGSAKAWANFNGTNGSIRGSYNVSSVTRNGLGDFTVNFTNALTDANYTAIADQNGNGSLNGSWMAHAMFSSAQSTTVAPTASNFRFCTFHPGNLVNQDSTYTLVSVFR